MFRIKNVDQTIKIKMVKVNDGDYLEKGLGATQEVGSIEESWGW
jgi:hypothetical protein